MMLTRNFKSHGFLYDVEATEDGIEVTAVLGQSKEAGYSIMIMDVFDEWLGKVEKLGEQQ